MNLRAITFAAILAFNPLTGWATETGGSVDPTGSEGFMTGMLPPPGMYWLNYLEYYTASRDNNSNGKSSVPGFSVSAVAEAFRFVHVTPLEIMGGNVAWHMILPAVNLSVTAAGAKDQNFGVGDITVGPAIGWHGPNLHFVLATDFYLPTGAYNQKDLANIGRNYYSVQPLVTVTNRFDNGFELSAKLRYTLNTTNSNGEITPVNPTGAGYLSGQEAVIDFAAGQIVGDWQFGVQGYYYRQVTDDSADNAAAESLIRTQLKGNRGEAFALGPTAHGEWAGVNFLTTWEHEFMAVNRPEGDRFWLKTIVHF